MCWTESDDLVEGAFKLEDFEASLLDSLTADLAMNEKKFGSVFMGKLVAKALKAPPDYAFFALFMLGRKTAFPLHCSLLWAQDFIFHIVNKH
jgi:hypothetical protein